MILSPVDLRFGEFVKSFSDKLDIPQSLYEKAIRAYQSVGTWIGEDKDLHPDIHVNIYPQGSFRLGTVVKPIEDDYDIDLICEITLTRGDPASFFQQTSPSIIWDWIGSRLKEHETYNKMLEEKDRCWRLNYAGEFHMDILPAIPDLTKGGTAILVPNEEKTFWRSTNPEGYACWFENKHQFVLEQIKKASYSLQKVPENTPSKSPLQRAVQVLKRHRDRMFIKNPADKPISIILTILAGHAYKYEQNESEALRNILLGMEKHIVRDENGHEIIANPSNIEENYADKWIAKPVRRDCFYAWLETAKTELLVQSSEYHKIASSVRERFHDDFLAEKALDSLRKSASAELSFKDTEEYIEDKFDFSPVQYSIKIECKIKQNGFLKGLLRTFLKRKIPLLTNKELTFYIVEQETTIPGDYELYWKVRNVGAEAESRKQIRGQLLLDEGNKQLEETTDFKGRHYVECYAIQDGLCVAQARIDVPISTLKKF